MKFCNVLITGCSRGLGLQFVKEFLRLSQPPKRIVSVCRQKSTSQELLKLASEHSNVHVLELDVRDDSQYPRLAEEVKAIVGDDGINLLINNAGICDKTISTLQDITKENLMSHYETNVVAPVLLVKELLPLLEQAVTASRQLGDASEADGAAVVNISSTMGSAKDTNKLPLYTPYRLSKAALNKFTHCLAFELASQGILVTAVHPGWVRTDMGTQNGLIDTADSVQQIVKNVVLQLGPRHHGKLFLYNGQEVDL